MKKCFCILILIPFLFGCYETDVPSNLPDSYGKFGLFDGAGPIDIGAQVSERYNEIEENPFISVDEQPVSTFSIDADGASYSNVRRFLMQGYRPPKNAIRTEELINYFSFDYGEPSGAHPVAVNGEITKCPWKEENLLIRIGIKGKTLPEEQLPPANFVLLIDVSGSMSAANKLELLKKGFIRFAEKMRPQDRIAIVTYAGRAGVALQSTPGSEKHKIIAVLEQLESGGSTAGAEGIITAYEIAGENYVEGGNNRVILGTDGDFNVGISTQEELIQLIESKRDAGIFLTVLGYGEGNLFEAMMEQVANKGNGNYEYIDNIAQSDKVFINEYSKFYTVAKDVKVQVEFNKALIESYRLIGYENRLLEKEDFEDDNKDAGEIGSGQCITALYEVKPSVNPSSKTSPAFNIEFRYKVPGNETSKLINLGIINYNIAFENASESMRFAAAVAGYGMLLRDSPYKETLDYSLVRQWATGAMTYDPHNYRSEFIELIDKVMSIK